MLQKHKAVRTEDNKVLVTLVDENKSMKMDCTMEEYDEGLREYHECGAKIQTAFPFLSASEREFLMSGVTDDEWDYLFGEDEDI